MNQDRTSFEPDLDRPVEPQEWVSKAKLALHHHMAPADGGFDVIEEVEE